MKKKVLVGTGIIVGFVVSFFAGSALADNNFMAQMTTDATHKVLDHANQTTKQLVDNIDNEVQSKMQDAIDTKVQDKNQEVDKQLQDYYNQKIDAVVNGDNSSVTKPIDAAANNAVTNDKKKIDDAFNALFNQ